MYRKTGILMISFFGGAAEGHWIGCCRHSAPPKNKISLVAVFSIDREPLTG
jgi:hypothetical protein